MRTRIPLLLLLGILGCSNDDDRGRFDINQDPSTASGDGGDPRDVRARDPDSGPGNVIGSGSTGRPRSGLDAGGSLDAAAFPPNTSDSAAPNGFECQTANDCAIRNVGSCCGYFPRCANANAIFTTPNCASGMGSVCGFPTIDSCTCELGQCVSLQAGVRVTYP